MFGTALDLGTTNSVAAVMAGGRPQVVPLRGGSTSLPSAVAVDDRGRWLVGREARVQRLSRPRQTLTGMKALVGRSAQSTALRQLAELAGVKVLPGPDDALADLEIERISLIDSVAMVLRELRGQAQDNLGREIRRAVIPVPDYFADRQREALAEAGRRAGLAEVFVRDESDCLTRLVEAAGRGRDLRVVFLYGLGGGSFDATVLERTTSGRYEVMASTGEDLGGDLFDRRIARHLHDAFVQSHGLTGQLDPVALSRILEAAEAAKIRLDASECAQVHMPFVASDAAGNPLDLIADLDREGLLRLTGELVLQSLAVTRSVLRTANVSPGEVDGVFLYGRAARAREVQAASTRLFQQVPVRLPEDATALGAAVLASAA